MSNLRIIVPVLSVSLTPATFNELMDLVEKGRFLTPEQFLTLAVYNQLALERSTGESPTKAIAKTRSQGAVQKSKARGGAAVLAVPLKDQLSDNPDLLQAALARFARPSGHYASLACAPMPEKIGIDRIWGQVNRLFPLKMACRWIYSRATQGSAWPKLKTVLDQLPRDAAAFGSFLESVDASAKRSREGAFSAGLPRAGNLASCDRFASQFIARVTRTSHVYPGAAFQLGLALLVDDEVHLTDKGRELALLQNPLLDSSAEIGERTLSVDECHMLITHVVESLPAERADQLCVLTAIRDGHRTPVALLSYVRGNFPPEWTDLAFRTHVYGILARLSELSQIDRIWHGRSVQYRLADSASLLVEQFANSRTA